MKRNKILISLSHDHHHGLLLAQLIKRNPPEYKNLPKSITDKARHTIAIYDSELIDHFKKEEKILFPLTAGYDKNIDCLITELIEEHCKITKSVDLLRSGIDLENTLNELGCLLENHIRKEERELFTKIEKSVPAAELAEIGKKLNAEFYE